METFNNNKSTMGRNLLIEVPSHCRWHLLRKYILKIWGGTSHEGYREYRCSGAFEVSSGVKKHGAITYFLISRLVSKGEVIRGASQKLKMCPPKSGDPQDLEGREELFCLSIVGSASSCSMTLKSAPRERHCLKGVIRLPTASEPCMETVTTQI